MVSVRLKEIIYKKLYNDLSQVEIIHYKDEIWFIDRNIKSWYFMYKTFNNMLWWRLQYFNTFFEVFSLTESEFVPVLSSWVEEVLNHKVDTTSVGFHHKMGLVEEVLNHKVDTTVGEYGSGNSMVEEVLNHKVDRTILQFLPFLKTVEEVLNHKVDRSFEWLGHPPVSVNVVLNSLKK